MREPSYLIVNADDYGYFACVSRGILDGARDGLITATGVMANSHDFDEHIRWLKAGPKLDVGVHLNLTHGRPLTERMIRRLASHKGDFPGKFSLALSILSLQLPVQDVVEEWRAQIDRCRHAGIEIVFLNSHEHLHMLPPLFSAILNLKEEYGIPYLRYAGPEWWGWTGLDGSTRNLLLQTLHLVNRARTLRDSPILLGMNNSGKLSFMYLKKRLMSLRPGRIYELMCHPGHFDADEIRDPRLRSYHHWQQELNVLSSPDIRSLCDAEGIRIVRYRDLPNAKNSAIGESGGRQQTVRGKAG